MIIVNRKLVEQIARSTPEKIRSGRFPGVKYVEGYQMAIARERYLEICTAFYWDVFDPKKRIISIEKRVFTIYHEIGHYFSPYFKKHLKKADPISLKEMETGGIHPFVISREIMHFGSWSSVRARYIFQPSTELTRDPKILHEEAIADAFAEYHVSEKRKEEFKNRYPEAFAWFDKHARCIDEFKTPVKGLLVKSKDPSMACRLHQ